MEGCLLHTAFSDFSDAIRAAGLQPPDVIVPGKLHRFPGGGKRLSNRAGWCLLFEDGRAGCFGDWSTGLSDVWLVARGERLSRVEQDTFNRKVKAARKHAEAERRFRHREAAKRAATIWTESGLVPDNHSYLKRKRIWPHGAKLFKNSLVLSIIDFTGKLNSLQFIAPDGEKRLLSGGRKSGCFIMVSGDMSNPSKVIICEGWATGCTLFDHHSDALVLAAIDAGNLRSVAMSTRCQWPSAELIIAGDDDRLTSGNPGVTKAQEAAAASGARIMLPEWPDDAPESLSDFNDLAVWLEGGDV